MFGRNKSSKLKIAIIDDGFDWHVAHKFKNIRPHFLELKNNRLHKQRGIWKIYLSSHGTRCFAIYANATQSLPTYDAFLIKIIDDSTQRASLCNLEAAFLWCLENKINMISISLGTTYYRDFEPIQNIVNLLVQNGTIIVAAHSNDNFISFPAAAQNVIGVHCDYTAKLLKEHQYILLYGDRNHIDIMGCSKFSGLDNILYDDEIENYNSYATPYIAALIHNTIIENNNMHTELLDFFASNNTIIKNFNYWNYIKPAIIHATTINIPVIAFFQDSKNSSIPEFINKLCATFIEEGYIATSINLSASKNMFDFSYQYLHTLGIYARKDMISYVSYYTQANLLFIQLPQGSTDYNYIDLILDEKGGHCFPIPSFKFDISTPNSTYIKIKDFFM
ncbi:MAG: hypothetical protein JTJ28_19660 [Lactobacillus sp.]|nr:hypothetical protein [Lactobacillus sp.]